MTMTKAQNPAILQFEIDTRRFAETKAGGSFRWAAFREVRAWNRAGQPDGWEWRHH